VRDANETCKALLKLGRYLEEACCDYTSCVNEAQFEWRVGRSGYLLKLRHYLLAGVLACCWQGTARAQNATPPAAQKSEATNPSPKPAAAAQPANHDHRFWDKENAWLFAGVGASRTLDYFSTLNLRRRGRQEILITNDVVDDHAGFAAVEAAGTGLSIGASYLFHRYGHHSLERWTSIVHIGLTTTGDIRNYCLKTAHKVP
jgi:hypothetical protein